MWLILLPLSCPHFIHVFIYMYFGVLPRSRTLISSGGDDGDDGGDGISADMLAGQLINQN